MLASSYREGAMKAARVMCRHCRRVFDKSKLEQKYCGKADCQKARKQRWSRKKYESDPDYRLNQKESTVAWLELQGGAAKYYREYRRRRRRVSESELACEANSVTAKTASVTAPAIEQNVSCDSETRPTASLFVSKSSPFESSANRDALHSDSLIKTGVYEIFSANANRDSCWVEIRLISEG